MVVLAGCAGRLMVVIVVMILSAGAARWHPGMVMVVESCGSAEVTG
ncbi:hypothetical protein CDS [Bradyrhizobium sp.]|nr:hypothetical protein CDS [Bradyrhizobium sp.]